MHWLLFIHKILFSSTCFGHQVLIFRRIQLYTCSIWYCHSLREFLVACRYTAWVRTVYRKATRNSHRAWQYHMLHVYNCILLMMSTWGSKHVEKNNILWIKNNQCIKLVINIYTGWSKSLWTWWLQYRKLQVMFKVSPPPLSWHLLTSRTVFSMTVFSITRSTFGMYSVMAIFNSSIVCGLFEYTGFFIAPQKKIEQRKIRRS